MSNEVLVLAELFAVTVHVFSVTTLISILGVGSTS
jgi:hypothetical protein